MVRLMNTKICVRSFARFVISQKGMNMESHKKKKPTKKQMIEEVLPNQIKEELKKAHIKGLIQGFEVANTMIMEYAKENSIEQVIELCKKNVEQKETMARVVEKGVN